MSDNPRTDDHSLDAFSIEEIQRRARLTREHLAAIRALWSGLVHLEEDERKNHPGKNAFAMAEPLRALFSALSLPSLTPKQETALPPEQRKERELRQKLRSTLDALGDQDHGVDPEHFEVELLARRFDRALIEQEIADELDALSRLFSDDALYTGARISGPGLDAISIARELARTSSAFRSLLAPMTDALRNMTKAARKVTAGKRTNGNKPPTTPT